MNYKTLTINGLTSGVNSFKLNCLVKNVTDIDVFSELIQITNQISIVIDFRWKGKIVAFNYYVIATKQKTQAIPGLLNCFT
jgi:hypothetical protein